MKKILALTGTIALAAIISSSAYAATPAMDHTPKTVDYQAMYDNTATLRASLAADRAELAALIASDNPDIKRVRELSASISGSEDDLRRQTGNYMGSMMNNGGHMMGGHMGGGHMNGNMGGCMW